MKCKQHAVLNPQRVVRGDLSVVIEKAEHEFYSEPNGGSCVAVHHREDGLVQVASTFTPDGAVQLFAAAEWDMLLAHVREDASYAAVLNAAEDMFTPGELSSFAEGVQAGAFTPAGV